MGAYVVAGGFGVLGSFFFLGCLVSLAAGEGKVSDLLLIGSFGLVLILLTRPIWLAFRSIDRKRERQRAADRARALAINAQTEHTAYIHGDDRLGVYGQFPPPEILDDGSA